jgi:hypothetical protein
MTCLPTLLRWLFFTPEWRTGGGGILDGITTCLQGASPFVADALQLIIGPMKMKDGDQVVLIDDYYGLPYLNRQAVGERRETELQAVAIIRLVEEQQEDQSRMKQNARRILIGPLHSCAEKERGCGRRYPYQVG